MDEVNLLSILVHINPFKFFISTLLIPYTFLFCHEHLFPKFTMFFPIEPRVQCRLRLIHNHSECGRDALGVPNRLRNENLFASTSPQPKQSPQKTGVKKNQWGHSFISFPTVVCNTLGVLNALRRDRESLIDLDHL